MVGSWCPYTDEDSEKWIQADFGGEYLVQKFATKPRDFSDGFVRYLTAYKFALSGNGNDFEMIRKELIL